MRCFLQILPSPRIFPKRLSNNNVRHISMQATDKVASHTLTRPSQAAASGYRRFLHAYSCTLSFDGPDESSTVSVQRGSSRTARCTSTGDHLVCPRIFPPSLLVSLLGWGLIDLPLRASNEGLLSTEDHQAPSLPLFCEHEGRLAAPFLSGVCI